MVLCMAARSERGATVGALRSRQLLSPLLLAAATTWIAVVAIWRHTGAMPGTMGLGVAKDRCLARCRSPLAFTLEHAAHRGRGRDLRAGMFGLMNVLAMLIVAAVVLVEKTWRWGGGVARAFGVASIVLALVVIVHRALAPGLYAPNPTMTEGTM